MKKMTNRDKWIQWISFIGVIINSLVQALGG